MFYLLNFDMSKVDDSFFQGVVNRDNKIIKEIYRVLRPKVIGWVKKNSGTEQNGKEVFQEALLAVFESLSKDKKDGPKNFQGYLMSIAKNKWRDQLKKRKRSDPLDTKSLSNDQKKIKETTEIKIEKEEMDVIFLDIFKSLDEACREFFRLRYWQEKSLIEIAKIMGYTHGTTKGKNFRCKIKLRELILNDSRMIELLGNMSLNYIIKSIKEE